MGIEGDDVLYTHIHQLLQSQCAVQRFTGGASVLSALIEEGHDHVDTLCFSTGSSNDTLQILIMVIGRHMVDLTTHFVGQAVVCDIKHDIEIISADGLLDRSFCLSVSETGQRVVNQVAVTLIALECNVIRVKLLPAGAPFYELLIHFLAKFLAAL